jgi:hypothetical protein
MVTTQGYQLSNIVTTWGAVMYAPEEVLARSRSKERLRRMFSFGSRPRDQQSSSAPPDE